MRFGPIGARRSTGNRFSCTSDPLTNQTGLIFIIHMWVRLDSEISDNTEIDGRMSERGFVILFSHESVTTREGEGPHSSTSGALYLSLGFLVSCAGDREND
jgi:hypothetical protein